MIANARIISPARVPGLQGIHKRPSRCGVGFRSSSPTARLVCSAAATSAASPALVENFWAWLGKEGCDISAVRPTECAGEGLGLVAAKDIKQRDTLLAVPRQLWLSAEAAAASKIGAAVADQPPWVQLALFLIAEKAAPASRWAPYLALLPTEPDVPLFWTAEELSVLAGSQLGANIEGYRSYVAATWAELAAGAVGANPALFPPQHFSEAALIWAFATLRSRAVTQLDGGEIALIPGLDLFNHSALSAAEWQAAGGSGPFGGAPRGTVQADRTLRAGEQVYINYGDEKLDSQLLLDFGFVDSLRPSPGFVLQMSIDENDRFRDDKLDVLQLAGLPDAPQFELRPNKPPPAELRTFLRLLHLGGSDAFLLEPIFREQCWQLIGEPVSRDNEAACCAAMTQGCIAAMAQYPAMALADEATLRRGGLAPRAERALRARLGEQQALGAAMEAFQSIESELGQMEYYQERRLRSLGLMDDAGNSTFVQDPFKDTFA